MTTSPGLTAAAIARAKASTRGRSLMNWRCASSSSDTSGYKQLLSWELMPVPSVMEPGAWVSFATLPYSVTTGVDTASSEARFPRLIHIGLWLAPLNPSLPCPLTSHGAALHHPPDALAREQRPQTVPGL